MLKDYINFNCHILLSQAISSRFLPLHSLGNIRIVYCSSDSIELGKSKQDVALCNYRSQGMMEEQTEAEVTRNSHFCFSRRGCPLFQTLQLFFVQPASCTIIRPIQSACPYVGSSTVLCGLFSGHNSLPTLGSCFYTVDPQKLQLGTTNLQEQL